MPRLKSVTVTLLPVGVDADVKALGGLAGARRRTPDRGEDFLADRVAQFQPPPPMRPGMAHAAAAHPGLLNPAIAVALQVQAVKALLLFGLHLTPFADGQRNALGPQGRFAGRGGVQVGRFQLPADVRLAGDLLEQVQHALSRMVSVQPQVQIADHDSAGMRVSRPNIATTPELIVKVPCGKSALIPRAVTKVASCNSASGSGGAAALAMSASSSRQRAIRGCAYWSSLKNYDSE